MKTKKKFADFSQKVLLPKTITDLTLRVNKSYIPFYM